MNKTYATKAGDIERKWHLLDAKNQILGRLATRAAGLLIGKDKVNYAPYLDGGDYVVVINASEVAVTGKKGEKKVYYRHSGYPGGLKAETLKALMKRDPRKVVRNAVWGMLPKNKLGRKMITRLYVYPDEKHAHKEVEGGARRAKSLRSSEGA